MTVRTRLTVFLGLALAAGCSRTPASSAAQAPVANGPRYLSGPPARIARPRQWSPGWIASSAPQHNSRRSLRSVTPPFPN